MSRPIIFGEIAGIPEGHWFENRNIMMPSSFHRKWGAGIDGNGKEGASAIVLSGGYKDDQDFGDVIIYTGAGGRNQNTGELDKDQSWFKTENAGLLKSKDEGLPVRVIRGHKHKSKYSPKSGYLYAGLYFVVDAWESETENGVKICVFKLEKAEITSNKQQATTQELLLNDQPTTRKESIVLKIIRNNIIARDLKKLYNYKCQICAFTIPTKIGHYAEGAHIKPLGTPHNGHDSSDNLLCLCPNHHVMFDNGSFSIADDLQLIGALDGNLIVDANHHINIVNLAYHRKAHGYN